MSLHVTRRTVGIAGAATLAGAAVLALLSPSAEAEPVSTPFDFLGETEQFTVPEAICGLTIEAFGAQGGAGDRGIPGGLGGSATAHFDVQPGDVLNVTVGEQGGDGIQGNDSPADPEAGAVSEGDGGGLGGDGGFNGGGGGGGGGSDVILNDTVLIVGGGGGGGGGDENGKGSPGEGSAEPGAGGNGGGETGNDGNTSQGDASGGGGGTQTAGGQGGPED